jgi:urocanate hydratase
LVVRIEIIALQIDTRSPSSTQDRNALLNAACGADLVTIHKSAGSGMGGSISTGHIVVADGTSQATDRIARCLHVDPGIGVIRHADAGYDEAAAPRDKAGCATRWLTRPAISLQPKGIQSADY